MAEGAPAELPPPLRIGDAERDSAMKALDTHLSAGRLGVQEYADRSAVAANATVAAELTGLFTDLPEPHPELSAAQPKTSLLKPSASTPAPESTPSGEIAPRASGFLDSWGGRLMAVAPFAALALFLIFHVWWVWLLIPAAGALFYGDRNEHDDRRRQNRRDRRDDRRR